MKPLHENRRKFAFWVHAVVWVVFWAVSGILAVVACLNYNTIAGTDKSVAHIIAIGFGVVAGPMVGPFANSGDFIGPQWLMASTVILFVFVIVSLLPFLRISRFGFLYCVLAWCGYLISCLMWFGSAILSLGYYLS